LTFSLIELTRRRFIAWGDQWQNSPPHRPYDVTAMHMSPVGFELCFLQPQCEGGKTFVSQTAHTLLIKRNRFV
jgi:hypothetical protein